MLMMELSDLGNNMDRKYVLAALGYLIIGLLLGIYMAASKNHGQLVTHAHIMLVGFLLSFVYGLCHKLWLGHEDTKLRVWQFYIHQLGAVLLAINLFLLYGHYAPESVLEPFLSSGSMLVLAGAIMMKIDVIRSNRKKAA